MLIADKYNQYEYACTTHEHQPHKPWAGFTGWVWAGILIHNGQSKPNTNPTKRTDYKRAGTNATHLSSRQSNASTATKFSAKPKPSPRPSTLR